MKKAIIVLLMITMVAIFIGCQPTPEKEIVVSKGDELSDLIQSTPDVSGNASPTSDSASTSSTSTANPDALYTRLEAPKHWSLETTALGEKLNITADVDIELPGVSQLPAATASLSEFTQEDLEKIVNAFGIREAEWTEAGIRTKEEIEAYLIIRKADLASLETENNPDNAVAINKAKESIAYNEQKYVDAPYESELRRIDFQIGEMVYGEEQNGDKMTGVGFEGITQMNNQPFYLRANSEIYGDSVIRVIANPGSDRVVFGGVDIDTPYGVALTKEQAVVQATEIAGQLIDELSLCYITPAATRDDETSRNWGWACVFMREINECPTAYEKTKIDVSLDAVSAPVDYEKMIIVIDDMGIISFEWEIPMTIESIDNPDVSLLSFDEISQRAIDQIARRYADSVNENIVNGIDKSDPGCTANIKIVKLGLMRISKVNSDDYYYIPVWKFFVSTEHTDEYYEKTGIKPLTLGIDEDGTPMDINRKYSLRLNVITINAIDGSVIDSGLGY